MLDFFMLQCIPEPALITCRDIGAHRKTRPMLYLLLAIIVIACLAGPQVWGKHVLEKYNRQDDSIRGTGAQFARHLLEKLELGQKIQVEETQQGDHYDPHQKCVRLNQQHFRQMSLAAMVIAAHEVGHAIQDMEDNHWLRRQQRMVRVAQAISTVAPIALAVAPVLLLFTRSPAVTALTLLIGAGSMAVGVIVQLMTLPVEMDASFNKALPILQQGGYLAPGQQQGARRILQAAAMTYLAASLYQLLNFAYWLRLLRRG